MKYKSKYGKERHPQYAGKPACILTDTGNGFKIKFPAYSSTEQDLFMSLDYSQASYLKECLNKWDDK